MPGSKTARVTCAVHREGAVTERSARHWHARFKNGNFDLNDAPCSGRPVEFDEGRLIQPMHENCRLTRRNWQRK